MRYHPSIPAETPAVPPVFYVNSVPGAGKTYAARKVAAYTLRKREEVNYVLVYAAPTLDLLRQFEKELRNDLKKVGNEHLAKHIHVIDSKTSPIPVHRHLDGLLNGLKTADHVMTKKKNGAVILVTHECLRLVPLDMQGKDRVSLIFDEARQCMMEQLSISAPYNVLTYFRNTCVEVHEGLRNTSIARWAWKDTAKISDQTIRDLWRECKVKPDDFEVRKFIKFKDEIKSSTQHVWVGLHSDVQEDQDFQVNVTLSPSRLFSGYGRVLILSAFFEYSQMYHMLKRQECDESTASGRERAVRLGTNDAVFLVNVTSQLVDEDRASTIRERRLKNSTMTYILLDESLGKYHINQGIVIPRVSQDKLKDLNDKYRELYRQETGSDRPPTFRSFLNTIRGMEDGSSVRLRKEALQRRDLLMSFKPSKFSVIQYLARASTKLKDAWLEMNNLPWEPMILCVNNKAIRTDRMDAWEKEELERLLNDNEQDIDKKRVLQVSVMCQGLNEWMDLNTASFIATTKMSPAEREFLNNLLPDYDPDLDRTVDRCVQFIFRTSIRDAQSDAKCLFVVSDRKLAEQVNVTLGSHMNIVTPQSLLPDTWKYASIAVRQMEQSKEQRSKSIRRYQGAAKYKEYKSEYNKEVRNTTYGRAYKRLSQKISRRLAALRENPDDLRAKAELEQLRAERASLSK
jgi:hypothetical protein